MREIVYSGPYWASKGLNYGLMAQLEHFVLVVPSWALFCYRLLIRVYCRAMLKYYRGLFVKCTKFSCFNHTYLAYVT